MSNGYIAEPLQTEQKFFNSQIWSLAPIAALQDSLNRGGRKSYSTFYAKISYAGCLGLGLSPFSSHVIAIHS